MQPQYKVLFVNLYIAIGEPPVKKKLIQKEYYHQSYWIKKNTQESNRNSTEPKIRNKNKK